MIAIRSLTFKPDIDDTRDAPSMQIIESLRMAGAKSRCMIPRAYCKLATFFAMSSIARLLSIVAIASCWRRVAVFPVAGPENRGSHAPAAFSWI